MKRASSSQHTFRVVSLLVVVFVLVCFVPIHADQGQYFYDQLGRLVGVVDGQGNMAVYNYDAVGNLLSIERFSSTGSGGSQIGIFLLSPSSALVGTTVQIRGFGFSATPSENQVAFDGRPASVLSSTTNTITTVVPAGATTGPVTVTTTNGTATGPQAFTVLVPPIIVGIDPARVAQGTTMRLVITGFNLMTVTNVQFVQTGLSAAVLSGVTAQSLPINLTVDPTVPAGTYPFSVVSPLGVAQSGVVTVTVAPAMPSFGAGKLSVFLPFPAQVAPSGSTHRVAPSVSVSMP